jgi:glutathione S-transferase
MADAPKLTLYAEKFWYSPYVFSVFVALREKGLPFDEVAFDLFAGEHKQPAHRARMLTGRVPALDHDGFTLGESSAIVEYLDEAFPAPKWPRLLPDAPKERGRARQLMAWVRSDLMAIREERPTSTMFYARATEPLSKEGRDAAEKLFYVAEQVIPDNGGPLFGNWSIADADFTFMLHRLLLNDEPVTDKVRRYAQAQWQRPSLRAFVEHDRPSSPAH